MSLKNAVGRIDTRDHSTFNWVERFLVMGRIFKAARPMFNVISDIEDYINEMNNLKNYP